MKRDSRGRFVKKSRRTRRRKTTRRSPRRRSTTKSRKRKTTRSRPRKTTRRRRTTRASSRRRTPTRRRTYKSRTRTRRRTRRNPPKFKLLKSTGEVLKLGAYAVSGYSSVGLAAYAVDHMGLAKWKAQQLEANPDGNTIKLADVGVRILAAVGLGYLASRFVKDKKCAAAITVGGAFNAVHTAVEHFVLDGKVGEQLPAPVAHSLAGYDGYSTLYDPAALRAAGVQGYQQVPHALPSQGVAGYQQVQAGQSRARAVAASF